MFQTLNFFSSAIFGCLPQLRSQVFTQSTPSLTCDICSLATAECFSRSGGCF
jgi:hypothetical protein